MSLPLRTVFLLACCALGSNVCAQTKPEPQTINDLRYGETLYHFYQENYFSAITRLTVAEKQHPIKYQGADPKLLLGSLYLSYGMHRAASDIFTDLLETNTSLATQDKIWYYLGRLRYLGGHYTSAREALQKVKQSLPPYHEGARWNLLANTFIRQRQPQQAIKTLQHFSGEPIWKAYAEFNLGVTLSRSQQPSDGTSWLDQVGQLPAPGQELRALRDRSNLALGYVYIQAKQPASAIEAFSRVRLSGPLSNKALLGIGWAHYLDKQYNDALVPWMELRKRHTLNTSVQEALLAIPHTLELIDKPTAALAYYNQAVNTYDSELNHLNGVLQAVENGELLAALKPRSMDDESLQLREQSQLPDSISTPYLSNLLASHEFQNTYQSYRELLFLQHRLQYWQQQVPSYRLMLAERQKGYLQKLKIIRDDKRLEQLDQLIERRDQLAKELTSIETSENGLALAEGDERSTLKRLQRIKDKLQLLQGHGDYSEQAEKFRLLNGLITWKLDSEFVARFWKLKRHLIELDRSIQDARKARTSLQDTWQEYAPSSFHDYRQRLNQLTARLQHLHKQIDLVTAEQTRYLQQLAVNTLRKRRRQLENYQIRAKYGLTRLYDKLHKDQRGAP
jgi:hypothetical protein